MKRQAATLQNEVNGLLNQADNALAGQKYDAAIGLYDEVLKRDPANQRAAQGRGGAIVARAVAQAASNAGSRVAPGKSFVSARTQAQSIEQLKDCDVIFYCVDERAPRVPVERPRVRASHPTCQRRSR